MKRLHTYTIALLAGAATSSIALAQAGPPTPPNPPVSRPRQVAPVPGPRRAPALGQAGVSAPRGPDASPGGDGEVGRLLRARRRLELTDDQVKKLEAMAAAPRPETNRSDMMRAQADMMDAMKGDGNLAGVRSALDKMSRLRNDQAIARLKVRQDMRGVLTATQKVTLDRLRGDRGTQMGARRSRGGPDMRNRRGGRAKQMRPGFNRGGPPLGQRFNQGKRRPGQMGPGSPMGPGAMGPGPMGPGPMGSGQLGPGQMGPGGMNPNRMGPGMNPEVMQRGRRSRRGAPPDSESGNPPALPVPAVRPPSAH